MPHTGTVECIRIRLTNFDSAKEITPCQRRVSAWSAMHGVGSLVGTEAKPDSFVDPQSNHHHSSQKPKITYWSSIVAGSIEPDVRFVSQWYNSGNGSNTSSSFAKISVFWKNGSRVEIVSYVRRVRGSNEFKYGMCVCLQV